MRDATTGCVISGRFDGFSCIRHTVNTRRGTIGNRTLVGVDYLLRLRIDDQNADMELRFILNGTVLRYVIE